MNNPSDRRENNSVPVFAASIRTEPGFGSAIRLHQFGIHEYAGSRRIRGRSAPVTTRVSRQGSVAAYHAAASTATGIQVHGVTAWTVPVPVRSMLSDPGSASTPAVCMQQDQSRVKCEGNPV